MVKFQRSDGTGYAGFWDPANLTKKTMATYGNTVVDITDRHAPPPDISLHFVATSSYLIRPANWLIFGTFSARFTGQLFKTPTDQDPIEFSGYSSAAGSYKLTYDMLRESEPLTIGDDVAIEIVTSQYGSHSVHMDCSFASPITTMWNFLREDLYPNGFIRFNTRSITLEMFEGVNPNPQ